MPGVQLRPRDVQQLGPHRGQRQVEHQQHRVADEQARDEPPHQLRAGLEQQRPGLQAVLLEGREQDRRRGRGRQAEGEQRDERACGGGVVGRLRAGDALDGAVAELVLVLGEPLLDAVRQERRDLGAAGGQRAQREAEHRAAQPRPPGPRPVLAAHPRLADRDDVRVAVPQPAGHPQRLADREQADRHDDDVDAVEQLRDAEGVPRLPGLRVDADEPDRQAEAEARDAADERAAEHARTRS